ncbi:integral membrane protein-like protein [Pirellula staleyi DSM 6068]|uniref:Integral membrane protein-like protein n=1 Tax=Pirellula staleyi (strain ATCC 27377 / DSM 6068 / ICPB 4128) TaxID=530564 RepID=D2QZ86_PIRSD|nr:fused MFS/spermidine synthase [Pirellula staleyi]ADB18278.1 integral membrane protein-like protein [Pirellula staleyi DSM 6068]
MNRTTSLGIALWSATTILVSAFLLFQVQPVISKTILPWFGGSPAVWTTCMLFFQLVLLAGYAYSHLLITYLTPLRQAILHSGLLVIAIITLPITPSDFWKPESGEYPALRILLLLLAKVGLPYFLLSSTGPLVQAWIARTTTSASTYRLYALSNIGSLGALLSYPFLIETQFSVVTQGISWSIGFGLFALLSGGLSIAIARMTQADATATAAPTPMPQPASDAAETGMEPPSQFWQRATWIVLPTIASVALLAITNYVCQDIAVTPFMWVVPLSLYLLSFIICFDSPRWYVRKLWGTLTIVGILLLNYLLRYEKIDSFVKSRLGFELTLSDTINWLLSVMHMKSSVEDFEGSLMAQAVVYLAILFFVCMVCHGELAKRKPEPRDLTLYFLLISVGGALGGILVALVCPLVFKMHHELAISITCGMLVGWIAIVADGKTTWLVGRDWLQWVMAFVLVGCVLATASAQIEAANPNVIAMLRNFYGTLHVQTYDPENEVSQGRALYHGRILHGYQYLNETRRYEPTTYYIRGSGAGVAVENFPRAENEPLRVAVIGLGSGTMATHGRKGDVYRFYDIDPKVITIANNYFTFLKDSLATTEVVLGDARIQMESELKKSGSQQYDVIILDAFSGDAIPAHLLTVEAMQIYEQHLRTNTQGEVQGVIAVHISNRYLDLEPVVIALAEKQKFQAIQVSVEEGEDNGDTGSDWILLTRNEEFLAQPDVILGSTVLKTDGSSKKLLWTDQHNSLWPILK